MDAVEFIREWKRMCETFSPGCEGCRIDEVKPVLCDCFYWVRDNPEKAISLVEEWSAAHPRKTRQSEFLKQWPEAKKAEDGVLCIRPCFLMADYQKESCKDTYIDEWGSDCYPCVSKFWMQEVD